MKTAVICLTLTMSIFCAVFAEASDSCASSTKADEHEVVLVLVDRTQVRNRSTLVSLLSSLEFVERPRTRLVLWRFGGAGADALPQLVSDVQLPDAPARKSGLQLDALLKPKGASAKYDSCVQAFATSQKTAWRRSLEATVSVAASTAEVGSDQHFSPILLAMNTAISAFSKEGAAGRLTVVVLTDGLEHTRTLSFYDSSGPPVGAKSLAEKAMMLHPSIWKGVRIHMSGVGVTEKGESESVARLSAIWREIIASRGAVAVELTPSVPQLLR